MNETYADCPALEFFPFSSVRYVAFAYLLSFSHLFLPFSFHLFDYSFLLYRLPVCILFGFDVRSSWKCVEGIWGNGLLCRCMPWSRKGDGKYDGREMGLITIVCVRRRRAGSLRRVVRLWTRRDRRWALVVVWAGLLLLIVRLFVLHEGNARNEMMRDGRQVER